MTSIGSALSSPRVLGWRGWTGWLVVDLALVGLLPFAPWIAAGAAGGLFLRLSTRRPPFAAALATYGAPLFWPLVLTGLRDLTFLLPNLLLFLCFAGLVWDATWEFPRLGAGSRRLFCALRDPVFLLALLLGLWLAVRCIGTPSPDYGRAKVIQYGIANLPLLLAGLVFFGGKEENRSRALDLYVRSTLVLMLVFAVVGIWNLYSHYWPSEGRIRVLGVNPIWVARFTGTAMLLVLTSWSQRGLSSLVAFPLLVLYAIPFYQAGSRGPLLALLIGLVVWWTLGGRVRRRVALAAVLVLTAGLLVLAIELGLVLGGSPLAEHTASNFVRAVLLKTVVDLGFTPGWFGLGTGGFSAAAGLGDLRIYPHNLFLEVWTELGWVGVALVLGWLGLLLGRTQRAWLRVRAAARTEDEGRLLFPSPAARVRVLAAVTACALVNAQLSGDLSGNALFWFWAGALTAPPERPPAAKR